MSTEQARYRWPWGIGGRNPALVLVVAVAAMVAVSCADSPLELSQAESLAQVQQADAGHTWRAGASPTWHGYDAPAVTHDFEDSSLTVCAEWADDFLFTRDDGRHAGIDFFSFEIGWWTEGASGWTRASVRNEAGTRQGCVVLPAEEDASVELSVKGMARDGSGRPTSTHHTVTWYGAIDLAESGETSPLAGAKVLYFADFVPSTDQFLSGLEALVAEGLIELTVATSRGDLIARLGDGPDVVVYFNQFLGFNGADAAALVNWIEQGQRLIFADWEHKYADLMAALEALRAVDGGGTNGNDLVFSDARLAEGVQQPMPLSSPDWGVYSHGLAAQGGGVSACTFDNGRSCTVLGNEGRTAILGFKNDVVTESDGHNLIRNLLTVVLDS